MNIICLKWGDKFSHEHVNRLYRMVCKNFHDDFNFICHTENANGIDRNIIIQPLPDYDLEKWWWKLTLFEYPTKVPTLFLDLDVVIQNDITHLQDYCIENMLCTVKCYWKPNVTDIPTPPHFDMCLNSSVMIWKGDLTHAWNTFIKDPEYFMMKYNGIDSFLYYNHPEILLWFSRNEIYSRLFGIDANRYWNAKPETFTGYFYEPSYPICIFNGWKRKVINGKMMLEDRGYDGFEKYWD
jgi:hypothetical protein